MKHIFYVHSGITYLVTLATIKYLKLKPDEVIIILCRSIRIDEKFLTIKLEPSEENIALLPSYGSFKVLKNLKVLYTLDRKIENATRGNSFILYLPSEKNYLMQFLQSHSLCCGRNFIEEGLLTYRGGFVKPRPSMNGLFNKFRHFLRSPFHLYRTTSLQNPVSLKDFTIYVSTKTAQLVLRDYKTVLLNVNSIKSDEDLVSENFTALYIFDAVVEMNLCGHDNFMECLENFIRNHVPRLGIAIKFHPFQKKYDHYLAIFDKYNIQYTLLESKVIPEILIAQQAHISVYGLSSSVLFYAKESGHEVHSFSSSLAAKDENFKKYVTELIPSSIVDYLKLL